MLGISVLLLFYLLLNPVESTGLFGLGYGFQRTCLCRCGISRGYYSSARTGRLPADSSVAPHEYPWLAAINIGPLVLTGSLISDRHVLTAASPLYGLTPDRITVTLGAHDRCVIGGPSLNVSVDSIILRPGHFTTNLENDLALIKLKHVVAFSEYISPICLPIFGNRETEQLTWTAGWPQTNGSCTPYGAVLPTLPSSSCFKNIESNLANYDKGCLGPSGVKSVVCKNDVGSPVMIRWASMAALRLIGVISKSSCDVTAPPLYTRVVDHVAWIHEHIRRDCQCF